MHRSRTWLAVAGLVAALTTAGCSSSGPAGTTPSPTGNPGEGLPGTGLAAAAVAAAHRQAEYRFDLVTDNGDGTRIAGRFGINGLAGSLMSRTGAVQVLAVGSDVYLNGPGSQLQRYLGAGSQHTLAALHGRWVRVTAASSPGRAVLSAFSRSRVTLLPDRADLGGATTLAQVLVGGVPARGISLPSIGVTLYVTARGPHYPVRLLDAAPDGASESFGAWGQRFVVQVPPPRRIVDLGAAT